MNAKSQTLGEELNIQTFYSIFVANNEKLYNRKLIILSYIFFCPYKTFMRIFEISAMFGQVSNGSINI